ncbi:unnamed protein product [Mortierella alpina]
MIRASQQPRNPYVVNDDNVQQESRLLVGDFRDGNGLSDDGLNDSGIDNHFHHSKTLASNTTATLRRTMPLRSLDANLRWGKP